MPSLGLSLSLSSGGGGFPFTTDPSTYWWDLTSGQNTVDTVAPNSISFMPELIRGVSDFEQTNKDQQPRVDANGGSFTFTPDSEMDNNITLPVGGAGGLYFGLNLKIDASGNNTNVLLTIRNAADTSNLIRLSTTGLKAWALIDPTDSGSAVTAAKTSGIIGGRGVWLTVEFMVRLNNDVEIWVNGVSKALGTDNPTTETAFASGTPSFVTLCSDYFGLIKDAVYYNGAISDAARSSISTYLNEQRP